MGKRLVEQADIYSIFGKFQLKEFKKLYLTTNSDIDGNVCIREVGIQSL